MDCPPADDYYQQYYPEPDNYPFDNHLRTIIFHWFNHPIDYYSRVIVVAFEGVGLYSYLRGGGVVPFFVRDGPKGIILSWCVLFEVLYSQNSSNLFINTLDKYNTWVSFME